jgi:hypothetical protein
MRAFLLPAHIGIGLILALPTMAVAAIYGDHIVAGFPNLAIGAHAPGVADRLFVASISTGEIQIVDLASRTLLPKPFLVVSDLPNPLGYEQGLLGLAFDPDYATNGYFYVNYTAADNSLNVRRYRVLGDPATSNVADPDSGHTIFHMPKPYTWHNAGWIGFGPQDGYLYITSGDPGNGNAQILTGSLYGKILRIDVRGDDFPDDPLRNYAIPETNPFIGKAGDDEIWANGLRNPWQASFDRSTGDLWINDVGELLREEVNYQPAGDPGGTNYGWPHREGSMEGPLDWGEPPSPAYTEPIFDYPHDSPDPPFRGNVIGGSALYRGPVAAWYGHYLFSDFGNGNIWKLDPDAIDPRASVTNVTEQLIPGVLHQIPAFTEDAAGNLYLMVNYDPTHGDIVKVSTDSKDVIWNGNDQLWGLPGNGSTWGSALNWTRDGAADSAFVAEDSAVFARSSHLPHVYLGRDRTVAAITFEAPYTLHDHTLRVLSGNVTVEAGVTATVASDLVAESANHSIRKLGSGTLIVEGDAGQTVVKEGTLGGTGSVDYLTLRSGGTVAPGNSAGILTVENSFSMELGTTLAIEVGGRSNANVDDPQFDQLAVGGSATLAGTLDVTRIDLGGGIFVPRVNDAFLILTAAEGITGWFNSLDLPVLPRGLSWELKSDGFTVLLTVVEQLPGDYNDDGAVNAADYVVWRNSAGQTGPNLTADGTGPRGAPDGVVDALDYRYWRHNFGAVAAAANSGMVAPGPRSIRLVLIAACLALPHIRRAHAR